MDLNTLEACLARLDNLSSAAGVLYDAITCGHSTGRDYAGMVALLENDIEEAAGLLQAEINAELQSQREKGGKS